jgi:RNA polymerase sigma-70 factor (ECF subfamily)
METLQDSKPDAGPDPALDGGIDVGAESFGRADPDDAAARTAFDRACRGERSAFGLVVRTYHGRIYNAVYRLVGNHDDAAEVTQDAFAKAFERLGHFRGESGPYTWIFRIATNAAISRLRKGHHRKAASLDELSHSNQSGWRTSFGETRAQAADPAMVSEAGEDHRAVVVALGKLDPEYRALLVMRDLEGFDYQQMAEVLDVPMGTLKSRLFRARVAMRELLQDHFETRRRGPPPS